MQNTVQTAQPFATQSAFEAVWDSSEAALYLRIHPRTLTRMARAGEIPAIHIGRLWRFRKSDLDAWLDNQVLSGSHPCRENKGEATNV